MPTYAISFGQHYAAYPKSYLFAELFKARHSYVVGIWDIPVEHKALFIHSETFVLLHLFFQYIQSIVEHKAEPRLAMPRFLCPRIALKTSGIAYPHFSDNSFSTCQYPYLSNDRRLVLLRPSTSLIPDFSVQRRRTLWYFGGLHTVTS